MANLLKIFHRFVKFMMIAMTFCESQALKEPDKNYFTFTFLELILNLSALKPHSFLTRFDSFRMTTRFNLILFALESYPALTFANFQVFQSFCRQIL